MDGLVLPVLAEEDPVDEALQRMSQLGSRAMMVRKPEGYAGAVGLQATASPIATLIEQQLDRLGGPARRPRPAAARDRTMFVVTRHEEKRDEIADAGEGCACHGPMRHTASNPPATGGSPCPVCGFTYSCW